MEGPTKPNSSVNTSSPPLQTEPPTPETAKTKEGHPVSSHPANSQMPRPQDTTPSTDIGARTIQSLFKPEDFSALNQALEELGTSTKELQTKQRLLEAHTTHTHEQLHNTGERLNLSERRLSSMNHSSQLKQENKQLRSELLTMQERLKATEQDIADTQETQTKTKDHIHQNKKDTEAQIKTHNELQKSVKRLYTVVKAKQGQLQRKNQTLERLEQQLEEARQQNKQLLDKNTVLEEAQEQQVKAIESQTLALLSQKEALAKKINKSDKEVVPMSEHKKLQEKNSSLVTELEQEINVAADLKGKLLEHEYNTRQLRLQLAEKSAQEPTKPTQTSVQPTQAPPSAPINNAILEKQKQEIHDLHQQLSLLQQQLKSQHEVTPQQQDSQQTTAQIKPPEQRKFKPQLSQLKRELLVLNERYDEMVEMNKKLEVQLKAKHHHDESLQGKPSPTKE